MKLHFSRESKHCARRGLSNKGFHQKGHIFSRPNPCFRSCPVPCWRDSHSAVVAPAPHPLPPPQMTSSASCLPWRPTLWSPGWPGRGLDLLLSKELSGRWVCTGGGQTSGRRDPGPLPRNQNFSSLWLCTGEVYVFTFFFCREGTGVGISPSFLFTSKTPLHSLMCLQNCLRTFAYLVHLVFGIYSEESFRIF